MLLDDIASFLASAGVVGVAWPCYKGYMPDEQDQVVAIFETGGMPADTLGRENIRPTFQVRVRGHHIDYQVVRQKWQDVFNALQDSTPAAGYAYVQAMADAPLVFSDANNRTNMTMNFRVMKSRS